MANPKKRDIIDIDIGKSSATVARSFICHSLGEGDINGDIYGVRLFQNGETYSLTGCTCVGYFIRPDGQTVVIQGTISGNEAWVEIPEACYVYEGQFVLSIKISGTNYTGTIRMVDGVVVNTSTGDFTDPGGVIPDLASWIALVNSANTAATNIGKIHIENELITGTRYKIKVYKDS